MMIERLGVMSMLMVVTAVMMAMKECGELVVRVMMVLQ